MRLREHEGVKKGKLDMLRADPRHLIVQPGYNVRDLTTPDAIEKLQELAASIAEVGVTDPLLVRFDGEKIIVVEGHRRLAATMLAIEAGTDVKSVPIYAEAQRTNDAQRDLGLIISNSGEPLTQLEKATVVGRLVAHGWTPPEIAKKCGWKSTNTVTGFLDMLALPSEVQKHVRDGDISATLARNIAKGVDAEAAAELIKANLEENRKIKGKRGRVTAATLKRDSAKAAGKTDKLPIPARAPRGVEREPPEQADTANGAAQAPITQAAEPPTLVETIRAAVPDEPMPVSTSPAADQPPAVDDLIDTLRPWAKLAQDFDLNERADDEMVDVQVSIANLKQTAMVFARVTGGESAP